MDTVLEALDLPQGRIAYRDSGGYGQAIVFIHGFGGSSSLFEAQFRSSLPQLFRLVAIDLPGHGASDDATDPATNYSVDGLADIVVDVFDRLAIERAIVVGWSLGGHIAIEMMRRHGDRLTGVMVTGAPPVGHGPLAPFRAFQAHLSLLLMNRDRLTRKDAETFATLGYGKDHDEPVIASILRADGRMRSIVGQTLYDDVIDQRRVVETSPIPLAMLFGAEDPIVRLNYVAGVNYRNLWENRVHLVPDAGHAVSMTHPHAFNGLLHRFVLTARRAPDTVPATAVPARRSVG